MGRPKRLMPLVHKRGNYRVVQASPTCFRAERATESGLSYEHIGTSNDIAGADAMIARRRKEISEELKRQKQFVRANAAARAARLTTISLSKIRKNCRNGEALPDPDNAVRGNQSAPLGIAGMKLRGAGRR